jgi:nitrite reductase/ring-hydroxylating ferredoxin subunit
MLRWRFKTYVSSSGRTEVQDEIDQYEDYSREKFSRAVAHLSVSTKDQWNEPQAKKLKNENPLYEIKYTANRCQTRAIGFFDKDGKTFVITNICTHKQRVYDPPDAFKTAHKRRAQIDTGTAASVPLQIFGENFPADEK